MLKVPMTKSTSFSALKCSAQPRPPAPITPMPCASSTIRRHLYLFLILTISGRLARSPSMLKTPSTITRAPVGSVNSESIRSRSAISLCLYLRVLPKDSRQPSTMLAWLPRSIIATSSLPTTVEMTPWLVWNPVEKVRAASLRINRASWHSSSSWISRVPFRKREPVQPEPYFSTALMAASLTRGSWVSPR